MNRYLLPALIGTVATITLVQTVAISLDPSEIIKSITVKIDGANQGTGFIIARKGNTYTILTNWHVLEQSGNYTQTNPLLKT